MSPDEIRNAKIQRQHSQEMAIRFLVANKSKATDKISWEVVVAATDDFERDIQNAVALRSSSVEVQNNGNEIAVAPEEVITLDRAMMLVEKIQGAPETMHPMIKVKMGSLGVKGAKNLTSAIGQLTPEKADQLEDYIDAQFDAVE